MQGGIATIDLNGAWELRRAGEADAVPATVPGCVHGDLLAAGRIPDPYDRDNEDRLQWIAEGGWVYSRSFQVPPDFARRECIVLRCLGLDTLATLFVNGTKAGRADNMFRTWVFEVRDLLQPGENRLEIWFDSAVELVRARQMQRALPDWHGAREIAGRAWLRKEPCNFGWDWGPVLTTCGIWRDVALLAWDGGRLLDFRIRQDHAEKGRVGLELRAAVQCLSDDLRLTLRVRVLRRGAVVAEAGGAVHAGEAVVRLTVEAPELWWPNGLGAQPLYEVEAALLSEEALLLECRSRRIGLRELRLVRQADEWGESFRFTANGVPFFAKGANWIPSDALSGRRTPDRIRPLLRDAALAHMNMLRVWGGGTYESDAFYDACDELGLCVWQDFMFACSTYPAFDPDFLAGVRAEAVDNVRRLRHHPCIALWCGNNEIEQGLTGDAWNAHQMSWQDYGALFDRLLPAVLAEEDPDRAYWPGSPHSPRGSRADFNNPACGDAHLWSVWHGRQPFEWYRTALHRFCSEFGFESFPEPRTVRGYTLPDDRNVSSWVMEHHQRCGIGNTVIVQYLLDWFRMPRDFDSTLWLSQISQGLAMQYAVLHWRRHMPRCMGALYWQLNDCWPVASWSSIDYHGRWKALHHLARRFFAPQAVSAVEDQRLGTAEVHVTNDACAPLEARVRWTAVDMRGAVLGRGDLPVRAAALSNTCAGRLDFAALLEKPGRRDLLVRLELFDGDRALHEDLVLFARPKHLELSPPALEVQVEPCGPRCFRATVRCAAPALWVWLELDGIEAEARYSDNFFHCFPDAPRTIEITTDRDVEARAAARALRVRSLQDTY